MPRSLQEHILRKHPDPTDDGNEAKAALAVDLGALDYSGRAKVKRKIPFNILCFITINNIKGKPKSKLTQSNPYISLKSPTNSPPKLRLNLHTPHKLPTKPQ